MELDEVSFRSLSPDLKWKQTLAETDSCISEDIIILWFSKSYFSFVSCFIVVAEWFLFWNISSNTLQKMFLQYEVVAIRYI